MMNNLTRWVRLALRLTLLHGSIALAAETPRQLIVRATLAADAATQRAALAELMGQADTAIAPLLEA